MNEAKFTKGPWAWGADRLTSGDDWVLSPEYDSNSGWAFVEICDDDKNLIAAAPELYEALFDLMEQINMAPEIQIDSWGVSTIEAYSALAKARGEHEAT